ncbi:MAG TPA: metalloregulator ArsR/SmtB family transcription factor [Candidatus Cybelea sp.]|nr:metalloregulator ArsR/SmtB family transcription factor [Candidatus Cybelea sp.]
MDILLNGLRAAGEPTRLRLLALCAHGELTVSELTQILGQSQPRVSRHLKLLCEAGLLDRFREGTWAFYRLAERGACAALARTMVDLIPENDATLTRDLERLEAAKQTRAEAAAAYFRANAARWSEIRSLHVADENVEAALMDVLGEQAIDEFLDVGTGTGRILELLAPRVGRGVGIDLSREMLAIARSTLENANLRHCQVRLGDMYHLPVPAASFDVITFHQVLHYADDPSAAIAEAARVLKPGGRVAVVDFEPHDLEYLREQHAHRRLGFSEQEVAAWYAAAGLELNASRRLAGDPLTVGIWLARQPGSGPQ